ncbi:MAG: diaminopimelate decarboxylase [Candidatus Methylomirabilales bacterium]
MHHFHRRGRELYCEEVPVAQIAEAVGTPFYLYSHATLTRHFRVFDEAFRDVPHLICFAVKANANLSVLRLFGDLGGGADVVSGGELFRAIRAGIPPDRIVFAGVGKTETEMAEALKADILLFNVESVQELERLSMIASRAGVRARVALRVNPDIDPETHPYIATGLKQSKFGIEIGQAMAQYRFAQSLSHVEVVGVHQHIGSQITDVRPFIDSLTRTAQLVEALREAGFHIHYLDVGGGLGITYKDEVPPLPDELARAMIGVVRELGCTMILEPGRVLVGNAGILVTRVLYTKESLAKHFIVVDAGMNDLLRPSLYGSFHGIEPVLDREGRGSVVGDVVGPICESGDFLAKDRTLPAMEPGELLAIMSAGAYGFTMASNYNARPRAAEVLVRGKDYSVIRRRESYEDLVRGEEVPDGL